MPPSDQEQERQGDGVDLPEDRHLLVSHGIEDLAQRQARLPTDDNASNLGRQQQHR